MGKLIDIVGQRYGRLLVVGFIERRNKHSIYKCLCDCGREVEASSNILRVGKKKSCGCYNSELIKTRSTTHGLTMHPLFRTWCDMKNRCYYVKHNRFLNYGGKGIKVHEPWLNFINFYNWATNNGWEKGLTIDRIDNNKNYEPNNCKFSTIKQQNRNRTTCKYIEYNGQKMTIVEWSEKLNIPYGTLQSRLKRGWSVEKAFIL